MSAPRPAAREQLKTALAEASWSQRRLERELGVSDGTASRWLNGEKNPDLSNAFKIEDLLGVPARAWEEEPAGADSVPPAPEEPEEDTRVRNRRPRPPAAATGGR